MSDPLSMAEKYLSATASSHLQVDAEKPGDVDKLIAAGSLARDPRKDLALRVWRVRATGSARGVHQMAEELGEMLAGHGADRRQGRYLRSSTRETMHPMKARMLAMTVLKWWRQPRCQVCNGLGHPKMPNAPILDTTRVCPHCHGTGVAPLELRVRHEHIEHARWLVSQMEGLSALVFDQMARKLSSPMDFLTQGEN